MRKLPVAIAAAAIVLSAQGVARAADAQLTSTAPSKMARPAVGYSVTGEHRFAFSDADRVIMRRYVSPRRQVGVTTGNTPGPTVNLGERIPDAAVLRAFPSAVYHESPGLRPYRYILVGGRAFVVDPRERTVIEEID
jgi:hypothetical protein